MLVAFANLDLSSLCRLEDNLVVGSVGFDTRDGFQASKHFDNDARRQRAAQKRALFLQQEISEEGPRSCSPPPSPPLPPPNTVPDPPPIHQDEPQNNKPWISKSSSGIQERVRLLEQNLAATDRAKSLEPEEWGTNHNSVRGPGSASPIHRSENSSTGPRIDSPASRRDIAVSPDRRVLIDQKDLVPAVAKRKVSRVHKAKSFLHRAITGARRLPESESQEINMAGVPPPPSSGVDMGLLQNLLQKASEDVQLQNASNDEAWKGTLNGVGVKIYAPHSSQQMRQTCGVSWDMLAESFLDTATTAAGAGGHRRLGTVKKRGVFSREEDQILLAPAGPYVAKTISAQECKYLAKVASRYVEHFQDCQNSLLPRCYVIMRIAKGGRVKSTEHWVVTDNLNDLPLPVRLTYDLKGVYSRVTKVASGNEPMVVLKEGNLPQSNKIQSLPQVSTLEQHLVSRLLTLARCRAHARAAEVLTAWAGVSLGYKTASSGLVCRLCSLGRVEGHQLLASRVSMSRCEHAAVATSHMQESFQEPESSFLKTTLSFSLSDVIIDSFIRQQEARLTR